MKINRIQLNCRHTSALGGEMGADPVLLLFRTPVEYIENGIVKRTSRASAHLARRLTQRVVRSRCAPSAAV